MSFADYGGNKIGEKFGNTTIRLQNVNNQKMPTDKEQKTGEIVFSGPGIMVKYINNDKLTEETISHCDGKKLFHTKDIGKYTDNNSHIQILGRMDSMVKVRGMRVDLSEIEYRLSKIENIDEVATKAFTENNETYICAYYSTLDRTPISIEVLKNELKKDLNSYMIPSFLKFVTEFKRNEHGKLDLNALEGPKKIGTNKLKNIVIDDNICAFIVRKFENILKCSNVGLEDNFISLGGNSLSAMKLQIEINKEYNISIPASDILMMGTPKLIAEGIKNCIKNGEENSLNENNKYSFNSTISLSESQLNVYLDEISHKRHTAYNNPIKVSFNGFDKSEITNAVKKLIEQHPILKARVDYSSDTPKLRFDSQIDIETIQDINSFVQPFELEKSLSKFCLIETEKGIDLYVDIHHLILDGTSMKILVQELVGNLENPYSTASIDIGVLRDIEFGERVKEQNQYQNAKIFFENMLCESDNVGDLIESVGNNKAGGVVEKLPIDIDRLNNFLRKQKITLSQYLISAFSYTLSRFTGSDNALFCMIEDGRGHMDLENAVGMFVKTIPLLIDCENTNADKYLDKTKKIISEAMKYDFYPFRLLAKSYNITSDITFQYSHDIRNTKDSEVSLKELKHDLVGELSANVFNGENNSLYIKIEHSKKYNDELCKKIISVYKKVLTGLMTCENLSDINYTTKEDIDYLDSLNATEAELKYSDILEAFKASIEKYPNNKLVTYEDISYTYSEGARIISAISNKLCQDGIPAKSRVAILTQRSHWYLLCALGVLTNGCAYVPIDDSYPDERMAFMLKDTSAEGILVTDETIKRAEKIVNDNDIQTKLINVDRIDYSNITDSYSYVQVDENDTACVLYTSGTTGVPKGSLITRKAILNLSQVYALSSKLSQKDVYGLYSSFGFDAPLVGMYPILLVGASLCIIDNNVKLDMQKLNNCFTKCNVTHTLLTTQVAKTFIQINVLSSLKVLYYGGEKSGFMPMPNNYKIYDACGPTEYCVFFSKILYDNKKDVSSVGTLNVNTKGYILDSTGRQVPVGAVGELCLSGYQLAKGYLNREKETEEAFLDNPFDGNKVGYEKMYKTGDMVRVLPDGTLGFIGRKDSQVKIRGNRVELGEVETCIRQMDSVKDTTVVAINNNNAKELVAYVVVDEEYTDKNKGNITEQITKHISDNKPAYMVPAFIEIIDRIPLNVNGKVDKRALPEVNTDKLKSTYVAPTNETEKAIVEAFEKVLNQENIGIEDDFIRLGGDSLSAIRVVSYLSDKHIEIDAKTILSKKTASIIAKEAQIEINAETYEHTEGKVRLLPIQSYFFEQINKNNFVQTFALKAKTKLDKEKLEKAFNILSNHHDMLRASYIKAGKQIIQEIQPQGSNTIKIDYIKSNENTIKDDIISKMNKGIENLDVYTGKLIYVLLVDTQKASYLTIAIHHLIVDGISWNILINDLTKIYTSLVDDTHVDLIVPYPYKRWVDDIYEYSKTIDNKTVEEYRRITDKIDDEKIKGKAIEYSISINRRFDAENMYNFTEEEILLTALARAYKKTYDEDIILNMETHGRDDSIAKVHSTVGWFTAQYPLSLDVSTEDDDISVISDVLSVQEKKTSTKKLGIDYGVAVYIKNELKYKHSPVTFNYLSEEFLFENSLFSTFNVGDQIHDEVNQVKTEEIVYGLSFNITKTENEYIISGQCAGDTYLSDKFVNLINTYKSEIDIVVKNENIKVISPLTESQMGVYLDEKTHKKGTAYSCFGYLECKQGTSEQEAKEAIETLIEYHPVLTARVAEHNAQSLLICDVIPKIECLQFEKGNIEQEFETLIKPFNLAKELSRFWIVKVEDKLIIAYDMHHIISDATSRILINKELKEILNGKKIQSIDLGFLRSSLSERKEKNTGHYKQSEEFYEKLLCEIDETGTLIDDVDGSVGSVAVPIRGVKGEINKFCQKHNTTIGTVLNIVFGYTLSRFTGTDKVTYNFTSNGRYLTETQNALGMYVKTMPNVIYCTEKPISEFIEESSETILKIMDASVYPYRLLATKYGLTNNISFEYNNTLNDVSSVIADDVIESDKADTVSDFSCVANDLDDGYLISISHSKKYSQDMARRFARCYKKILTGLMTSENLSDIEYTDKEEIEYLDSLNATEAELKYHDILEAFKESIEKYPNNKLVTYEDISYTYSEGAKVITAISEELKQKGIEPKSRVAILTQRSHWYLLCALGVLTNGSAYVPIDDSYPDERIAFMLKDTRAEAILVTDETIERTKQIIIDNGIQTKIINVDKVDCNCITDSYSYVPVDENDTACILYTSGTTGVPKGSLITRKGILNLSHVYTNSSKLNSEDVYGLYSSIGFDAPLVGMYPILLVGASLCVVDNSVRLNMQKLNDYFIKYGITHTLITTQVIKVFLQSVSSSSLKCLHTGGDKLGNIICTNLCVIYDDYGSCEGSCYVSNIRIELKNDNSSIGKLNANTKGYILDSTGRRVPVGAVGELYLSGYQLAKGYLNREKETKEAFLDNPFDGNKVGYEKMYKTGDMVRVLSDGTLGFIGRKDSQVKIRGNRVELGEVETCIRQIDFVKDTTVVAINNNNTKELVAYVVVDEEYTDKNTGNITEQITNHISDNKPAYMVPAFIEIIDRIPLNVNGKVDKRALPKHKILSDKDNIIKPQTHLEQILCNAICDVLGIDRDCLGINTNLKTCGLDSLSALRIAFLLVEKNNIDISATNLLQGISIKNIIELSNNCNSNAFHTFSTNSKDKKLVFVHPGMGGSEAYFEFSRMLCNEVYFSCIDHYNLNHLNYRIRGYKNIANFYVNILKKYQPKGPYYLGGWSLGGNIAYEMACILKSQGEAVNKVYMLDSVYQKNSLNQDEKEMFAEYSTEEMFKTIEYIEAVKGLSEALILSYKRAFIDQAIDGLDYIPSSYNGEIIMFKATVSSKLEDIGTVIPDFILKKMNRLNLLDNGYKDFVKKIKIKEIPFSHEHLMDYEPAKIIAETILDDISI